jgi:hypothetical protein
MTRSLSERGRALSSVCILKPSGQETRVSFQFLPEAFATSSGPSFCPVVLAAILWKTTEKKQGRAPLMPAHWLSVCGYGGVFQLSAPLDRDHEWGLFHVAIFSHFSVTSTYLGSWVLWIQHVSLSPAKGFIQADQIKPIGHKWYSPFGKTQFWVGSGVDRFYTIQGHSSKAQTLKLNLRLCRTSTSDLKGKTSELFQILV